jgi:hypothetical protein
VQEPWRLLRLLHPVSRQTVDVGVGHGRLCGAFSNDRTPAPFPDRLERRRETRPHCDSLTALVDLLLEPEPCGAVVSAFRAALGDEFRSVVTPRSGAFDHLYLRRDLYGEEAAVTLRPLLTENPPAPGVRNR